MFEKIVLRRSEDGPALSLGELAEALLFYKHVHIFLDHPTLDSLSRSLKCDDLTSLIKRENVSITFCEELLGTHTQNNGALKDHMFVAFSFHGKDSKRKVSNSERINLIAQRAGYTKKESSKLTKVILDKASIKKLSGDHFIKDGIIEAAWNDLFTPGFIQEAVQVSLQSHVPENYHLNNYTFEIVANKPYFTVFSDIDYEGINSLYKEQGIDKSISEAGILNNILYAASDMILAAHYGSDFKTFKTTSDIVKLRHKYLFKRYGLAQNEIQNFKDVVTDGRSVKEAINSKERDFKEFLVLLDNSDNFKTFIGGVNPDEKLVKAYFEEISKQSWINSLPSKLIRYTFSLILDAKIPLAGKAFSVADNFLFDKLQLGWKPNHFVDKRLMPFINGK